MHLNNLMTKPLRWLGRCQERKDKNKLIKPYLALTSDLINGLSSSLISFKILYFVVSNFSTSDFIKQITFFLPSTAERKSLRQLPAISDD